MGFRLLFLSIFIYANAYTIDTPNGNQDQIKQTTQKELLSLLPDDEFLGDPKAPVIMIGYLSFTCYHCAIFYKNELAQIKKKYIDTGKVLYVFRSFPMDRFAFKATMLSNCYTKSQNYFNFVQAVFESVSSWNYFNSSTELALLQKISALSNLKEDMFNKCVNDKAIENKVLNDKYLAIEKLGVTVSPTFFIKLNNDIQIEPHECKHEGHKKLEHFAKIIDKLYEQAIAQ